MYAVMQTISIRYLISTVYCIFIVPFYINSCIQYSFLRSWTTQGLIIGQSPKIRLLLYSVECTPSPQQQLKILNDQTRSSSTTSLTQGLITWDKSTHTISHPSVFLLLFFGFVDITSLPPHMPQMIAVLFVRLTSQTDTHVVEQYVHTHTSIPNDTSSSVTPVTVVLSYHGA